MVQIAAKAVMPSGRAQLIALATSLTSKNNGMECMYEGDLAFILCYIWKTCYICGIARNSICDEKQHCCDAGCVGLS